MFFFGRKNRNKEKDSEQKNTKGVSYHDDLLDKLTEDHKRLIKIYMNLLVAAKKRRQSKVQQYLKDFRVDFKIHHQSEQKQLYAYLLNKNLTSNELDYVRDLKKSSLVIYDNLVNFLSEFSDKKLDKEEFERLYNELLRLGDFLKERISNEEKDLYRLYIQ